MAFIADTVFDNGLTVVDTNGTRLDICSAEPTTYAQVNTGAPANGATDGRRVIVPAITAGTVTGTGTAAFWALTNGSDTLYATGSLSASQVVTNGNTFSLDAVSITIRDA